jgi:hypothetical protein
MVIYRVFFVLGWLICAALATASEQWVFVDDVSGNPQGGVILRYPDLAEHHAQNLSRQLSQHGWSTILVPIQSSRAGDSNTVSTLAAIEHMKTQRKKHNLVLLAIGNTWEDNLVLEQEEDEEGEVTSPVHAVVMVDVPGEFVPSASLPTLDISTTAQPVPGFARRQELARQEKVNKNQSVTLRYSTRRPAVLSSSKESFLTRRIRGWLHHHARGMEINEPAN